MEYDPTNLAGGMTRIWTADNIAIVVLMACLLLSLIGNWFLLKLLLPFRDLLIELKLTMAQDITSTNEMKYTLSKILTFMKEHGYASSDDG